VSVYFLVVRPVLNFAAWWQARRCSEWVSRGLTSHSTLYRSWGRGGWGVGVDGLPKVTPQQCPAKTKPATFDQRSDALPSGPPRHPPVILVVLIVWDKRCDIDSETWRIHVHCVRQSDISTTASFSPRASRLAAAVSRCSVPVSATSCTTGRNTSSIIQRNRWRSTRTAARTSHHSSCVGSSAASAASLSVFSSSQ